jgi:hypothetical protein
MKSNYKIKGNQKLHIAGLSDLHWGSEQFNLEWFKTYLDELHKIPKHLLRIYLGGDLVEHASKTVGNSAFKTTMSLDEQIIQVIEHLKPFKKNIIYSCMGNHEVRSSKDFDMDINRIIAEQLDCDYGNQCLDTFNINDNPFTIYVKHGKGSSTMAHLQQGKAIRETATIDANLYMEGHSHRLDFFTVPIRTFEGLKRKYYAFMGAFLNYNGYPNQMFLPILPPAFQFITINKDMIVRNKPYYIDQFKPELFEVIS